MKKDRREQILNLADYIAQQDYNLDFDILPKATRAKVLRIAEQQYEEAQQAAAEFHHHDR